MAWKLKNEQRNRRENPTAEEEEEEEGKLSQNLARKKSVHESPVCDCAIKKKGWTLPAAPAAPVNFLLPVKWLIDAIP